MQLYYFQHREKKNIIPDERSKGKHRLTNIRHTYPQQYPIPLSLIPETNQILLPNTIKREKMPTVLE